VGFGRAVLALGQGCAPGRRGHPLGCTAGRAVHKQCVAWICPGKKEGTWERIG